jgi:hypothetical protein
MDTGPANTLNYYIVGYVVFFTVSIIYLVSLALRARNLREDIKTMDEIEKKE